MHLITKANVRGIGCRKDTSCEKIYSLREERCEKNQISLHSIGEIASIDLKKEEPGLLSFCEQMKVELRTYSYEELQEVTCAEGFSESAFVAQVTGVGNVCVRAALKAAEQNRLIPRKAAKDGGPVAIAPRELQLQF